LDRAKRLECGAFTAAFPSPPSEIIFHAQAVNLESVNGCHNPETFKPALTF